MSHAGESSDQGGQGPAGKGAGKAHRPVSGRAFVAAAATVATILAALVPVMLALGAGYYSAVRQCNQDAADLETQMSSILLELSDREARMQSILAVVDKVPVEALVAELTQIEDGTDRHYGDPSFKDHSLVSLVNQYNRLLLRVQFPACDPPKPCPAVLAIDTQKIHPAIETLDVTQTDVHGLSDDIRQDMEQIALQVAWHKTYGPEKLCSILTLMRGAEPWKLIKLTDRSGG